MSQLPAARSALGDASMAMDRCRPEVERHKEVLTDG